MKLSQAVAKLRERVRQRVEDDIQDLPELRLPSLDDLDKRRQHAENWSRVVGTVNPRAGRAHDTLVQGVKRLIARMLRWYGHPQREFNQAQLDALVEVQRLLAEHNRNLGLLSQAVMQAQQDALEAFEKAQEVAALLPADAAARLAAAEANLTAARENIEKQVQEQRRSLDGRIMANVAELKAKDDFLEYHLKANVEELNQNVTRVQQQFWREIGLWKDEKNSALEQELRLIRQRLRAMSAGLAASESQPAPDQPGGTAVGPGAKAQPARASSAQSAALPATFDYGRLQERFRGGEAETRAKQTIYLPLFNGRAPVLDVACGRGEFLVLLRENGIEARGVDVDPEVVSRARQQNLEVVCADAFAYLEELADESLGAIFSAQFIEHLPPRGYVRLIELAFRKLHKNGLLLLETQNPQCVATLSQHFYGDPTHVSPIPPGLLQFCMEEAGFCNLPTYYVSPVEPILPALPLFKETAGNAALEAWNEEAKRFNNIYFGYQDYAVAGMKP